MYPRRTDPESIIEDAAPELCRDLRLEGDHYPHKLCNNMIRALAQIRYQISAQCGQILASQFDETKLALILIEFARSVGHVVDDQRITEQLASINENTRNMWTALAAGAKIAGTEPTAGEALVTLFGGQLPDRETVLVGRDNNTDHENAR